MNKPHIHATFIHAWADGAQIQYWSTINQYWRNCSNPTWGIGAIYRIKPTKKAHNDFI